MKKVIVIGLDGFESRIVEPLLEAGELPNLAKLRAQGGYAHLQTTYPALTPVAWSTFATGVNPGGHGVFDFIRRNPQTYLPDLALNRYEQKSALLPPKAVNLRRGTPVWELLSAAGVSSTIVRCPCTYPPDTIYGRMLAGMGVPDLRGGLGTSTFYSSDQTQKARESENVVRVQLQPDGTIATHLIGPRNPKTQSDFHCDMKLHLDLSGQKVTLRSDGQPKELELRVGQWSDWLKVKFKTGLLQAVHGMVRFYLIQLGPVFELYASPVNFDPDAPMFPISSPPGYAKELAAKLGTFYTTGLVEDHGGLDNRRFGETAYLDQCEAVLREREKMMLYELDRLDEGFLYCLFDTPDRVQHMFWRFGEPNHPANQGQITPDLAHVIEDHYRACDAVIGKVLQYADDQTLLVVLSDHGMSSFQRGLHLNTWLLENGFLALRQGVRPGEGTEALFHQVDWSRTKAYAVGMGSIYLNLKGREGQGIVDPTDAETVKAAIAAGLTGLVDPARERVAVRSVVTRDQVYAGPYIDEAPDLLVNFSEGYRISSATTLGGLSQGLFEDNLRKWAGDHIIDPLLVPGVFFSNRAVHSEKPRMVDVAPTVLAALDVPAGPLMEGASLLK